MLGESVLSPPVSPDMMSPMKKLFKWIGIALAVLILIAVFGYEDTAEKNVVIERYNKQNASVQACVKTLGEGVYSNKSLSWKLDNCNASK